MRPTQMRATARGRWLSIPLIIAIAGCGGSDSVEQPANGSDPAELIARVPPDFQLGYVNLAGAREQLDMASDTDPSAREAKPDSDEAELAGVAAVALHFMLIPEPTALAEEVVDWGAVSEAASNRIFGVPGITVIRTTQPFDQIAQELEERGFERDGDVVELDRGFVNQDHAVFADAGEGIVVLGWTRQAVDRALSETPAADPLQLSLLTSVEGVSRNAFTGGLPECVRGVATGQSFDPELGEIRIEVKGRADEKRLRDPEPTLDLFQLEDLSAEGNTLTAELSRGKESVVQHPDPASWLAGTRQFYDCG